MTVSKKRKGFWNKSISFLLIPGVRFDEIMDGMLFECHHSLTVKCEWKRWMVRKISSYRSSYIVVALNLILYEWERVVLLLLVYIIPCCTSRVSEFLNNSVVVCWCLLWLPRLQLVVRFCCLQHQWQIQFALSVN